MTPSNFWSAQRVLVTGGNGFLGRHVVSRLQASGAGAIFAPSSSEYDLRRSEAIAQVLKDVRPEMVIHLAAVVGVIGANGENPGATNLLLHG